LLKPEFGVPTQWATLGGETRAKFPEFRTAPNGSQQSFVNDLERPVFENLFFSRS
jgi:hypothetical protein